MKPEWQVYKFECLPSTNLYAKKLAEESKVGFALVIAATQTAGYGRFGRKWQSPLGGLWLSILVQKFEQNISIQLLPLIGGIVVAKTIQKLYGIKPALKWPNDVLIDDKKVAGILTECKIENNIVKYAIIGLGINFDFGREKLSAGLQTTATTLKEKLNLDLNKDLFIKTLLEMFEEEYSLLNKHLNREIVNAWCEFANILGVSVKIELTNGTVLNCIPISITDQAELVVQFDNITKKINMGECKNLRY